MSHSDGKEIFDWLMVQYPQAASSMKPNLQDAWRRELCQQGWDTRVCLGALKSYLRDKKPQFLPSMPQIVGICEAAMEREAQRTEKPKWKGEDVSPEEAQRVTEQIQQGAAKKFGKVPDPTPRPGWATAEFLDLYHFRRKHGIPVGKARLYVNGFTEDQIEPQLRAAEAEFVEQLNRRARRGE